MIQQKKVPQSKCNDQPLHPADTCVFGHVVLQLRRPLAFVATLWTEVLLLLLVNPHVKLRNKNKKRRQIKEHLSFLL